MVKLWLYFYNLRIQPLVLADVFIMGNETLIQNTELNSKQLKDETEIYNSFINVMVQIVEKYGKTVLQELDCAA